MKKPTIYPEIYVEGKFLHRSDIVKKVIRTDKNVFHVTFDHPVLGSVTEIFEMLFKKNIICLKCCFPHEMQTEEEIEIVKDYYNNFILEGHETYLEYYNEQVGGWYVLSRNAEDPEKPEFNGV
jgi:hypothetical protein